MTKIFFHFFRSFNFKYFLQKICIWRMSIAFNSGTGKDMFLHAFLGRVHQPKVLSSHHKAVSLLLHRQFIALMPFLSHGYIFKTDSLASFNLSSEIILLSHKLLSSILISIIEFAFPTDFFSNI